MPNDWTPNVPPVKKEFNDAARAVQKPDNSMKPVSKAELTQLEKERKPPALTHTPTPTGPIADEAKRNAEKVREDRMNVIRGRLDAQKGRAKEAFERSR